MDLIPIETQSVPIIDEVTPNPLQGIPLPTSQPLTIIGSGFTNQTRLTFYDGTNEYPDRIPTFVSKDGHSLVYNIVVGVDEANWTVVAYNGTASSNAYPFVVTAETVAPTVLLWANPLIVQPGDPVTLTWDTGNADSCQASGGTSEWDGPQALSNSTGLLTYPLGTTVYVLTCTGPGGSTTDVAAATVAQTGDYLLTLTTDRDPVVSGNDSPLIYTLTVRNQGSSVLPGVVLRDDVPLGMDVQSSEAAGGACSGFWVCEAGEYLTWNLGDLAPGESRVVRFTVRQVFNGLASGFVIHNEISVTDANGGSASLAKDVAVVSGNGDIDGDGLTNSLEVSIGTNMLLWDTDGDGLSDYAEVSYDGNPNNYIVGQDLNPFSIDTDGDGFSDYDEVNTYNSDPLDINSVPVFTDGDLNGDGLVNAADVLLATRILTGQLIPTQDQIDHGDVAPLVNGVPVPDGLFNLGDVLVIQRKALGLINY